MSAARKQPARWRWVPAGMTAPAARRVLFRGAQRLATAWEDEDGTWSWRLEGERRNYGPEPDQASAQREAKSAAEDAEQRRRGHQSRSWA